jgi:hypothetical protein
VLLLTVGLILVGFVLLLIGLFAEIYALVIAAIGCALAAGLVLLAFSRLSRRTAAPAQTGGAAPAQGWAPPSPTSQSQPAPSQPAPSQPASAWSPPQRPEPEPAQAWAPPPPPSEPTVTIATIGSEEGPDAEVSDTGVMVPVGASGDEMEFPIADYDELRVSEILPLLPELDLDELDVVRERELAGKRRAAVIDRIDDQMDELEAEAVPVAVTPAAVTPIAGGFPIADYDGRSVDEIVALVPDLSDDELDMLAEREEQGQNRAAILDAIDDQFEEVEIGEAELVMDDEALPPVVPVPAKLVPAKKVLAKKIPAKKIVAEKVPVKKLGVKKLGVKKLGVKKLGVKKLGVKKGPARKVAVKGTKAPVTRAPVKKVPVKKVTVKKVPAKKVIVKKAPARRATVKKTTVTKVVKKVGRPAKKR